MARAEVCLEAIDPEWDFEAHRISAIDLGEVAEGEYFVAHFLIDLGWLAANGSQNELTALRSIVRVIDDSPDNFSFQHTNAYGEPRDLVYQPALLDTETFCGIALPEPFEPITAGYFVARASEGGSLTDVYERALVPLKARSIEAIAA